MSAPNPAPVLAASCSTTLPPSALPAADQLAWLALVLTPGLGPQRILRAFRDVRRIERIFSMALTELEALNFPAEAAQFIFDGSAQRTADKEWRDTLASGAALVTFTDPGYPERLREIFDPPPVLWVRGDAAHLCRPGIAVVGTRRPSPYGLGMSEMLSRDLAKRGLVILSGMARGIDTAAHHGALAAGGTTVAVWGTGIDVVYPKENKDLAEKILQSGGTILSELPLGTFPAPQNFPKRNRIISGLSVGVLVVEAAENSGTRVTARCAMEQNRDVYAVPGNVTNKGSWGPNTLIKQGARLTATWEDVWEDLPSQVRLELDAQLGNESGDARGASLFTEPAMREQESAVYRLLRHDEALPIDDIMEQLDGQLTSAEIFTALFELELAHHIKQLPGKNYVRCM